MEQRIAISGYGADGIEQELVIRNFTDQDKIAARVASAVRRFVRTAPVTRSRSRMQLMVDVYWSEPNSRHYDSSPADANGASAVAKPRKRSKKAAKK